MTLRDALRLGTALASLGAIAPGAALAQSGAESRGGDDIVVTAQRREQSLQETPVAVSAFNSTMLQERGVTDVINIAASTPGLYISQGTASPSTLQIAMRGALEQNGGSITSESPVAIYIDDVYQSRLSAANYDLADIERVEVLRGPQGTLYGRNSMTGAIKLITRQPNGQTWVKVDASYARFNEVRVKTSVGVPLSDTIAFAGSAFYDERFKGWQYNETLRKDVSTFGRWGAQLAFGVTGVDKLEAVLTGRYINSKSDGQHFLPLKENFGETPATDPALPFYHTRTPAEGKGDNESWTASLRLGYELGAVTLRSVSAYQDMTERWALDFAGGYSGAPTAPVTVGFFRDASARQHQFTQELQLLGKGLEDKLNYIFGFFYFDEKAYQATKGDIFVTFPAVPSDYEVKARSLAGYGQVDWEFVPTVTASVGLRYTNDDKTFFGRTPDSAGTLYTLRYGVKANVWTPKFNLQWKPSDNAMVYGTVAKGYRASGFNSLNTGDPANFGLPYAPETAWSYELGAKFDAFDRALQVNLAAYYARLTNLQTLAFGPAPGSFLFQNAAKAEVKGIEVETTIRPTSWANFFANLAYTDDKYLELSANSQAGQAGATHLPLISRWQYQVGGTITVPAGEGSVDLSADYNYRSSYHSLVSLAPASLNPAIGRVNATATYKLPGERWEVYVQGSNVFGSKDWFASAEFVPGMFGYKIPLEPGLWRVGFRYKM